MGAWCAGRPLVARFLAEDFSLLVGGRRRRFRLARGRTVVLH